MAARHHEALLRCADLQVDDLGVPLRCSLWPNRVLVCGDLLPELSTAVEYWSVSALEKWTLDDRSVITVEDWALIRRLGAEGVPKKQIAARSGVSGTNVIKAVHSDGQPQYRRAAKPTSFAPFEPRARELLAATPGMPASVLVGWHKNPIGIADQRQ